MRSIESLWRASVNCWSQVKIANNPRRNRYTSSQISEEIVRILSWLAQEEIPTSSEILTRWKNSFDIKCKR